MTKPANLKLNITPAQQGPTHEYIWKNPSGKSYKIQVFDTSDSASPERALTEDHWQNIAEKAVGIFEALKNDMKSRGVPEQIGQLQIAGNMETNPELSVSLKNPDGSLLPQIHKLTPQYMSQMPTVGQATIKFSETWTKSKIQLVTPTTPIPNQTNPQTTPVVGNGTLPTSILSAAKITEQKTAIIAFFNNATHTTLSTAESIAAQLNSINHNNLSNEQQIRNQIADDMANTATSVDDTTILHIAMALRNVQSRNQTDAYLQGSTITSAQVQQALSQNSLTQNDKNLLVRAYAQMIRHCKTDKELPGLSEAILAYVTANHPIVYLGGKPGAYTFVDQFPHDAEIDLSKTIFLYVDNNKKVIGDLDRNSIFPGRVIVPTPKDKASRKAIQVDSNAPAYLTNAGFAFDVGAASNRCLDRSISHQIIQLKNEHPKTDADLQKALNYDQMFTREVASNYILNNLGTLSNEPHFSQFVNSLTEALKRDSGRLQGCLSPEAFTALQGIIRQDAVNDKDQKEWLLKVYAYYILNQDIMGDAGLTLAYSLAVGNQLQIAVIAQAGSGMAITSVFPDSTKPIDADKCLFVFKTAGEHYQSINRSTAVHQNTLKTIVDKYNANKNPTFNEFINDYSYGRTADVALVASYNGLPQEFKNKLHHKIYEIVNADWKKDPEAAKGEAFVRNKLKTDPNYGGTFMQSEQGRKLVADWMKSTVTGTSPLILRKDIEV